MTSSMTAFARSDFETPGGALVCELRSVNHRYLEFALRLPEELRSLEPQIRELIGKRLSRGKVDCSLYFKAKDNAASELQLNDKLVSKLIELTRKIDDLARNISSLRAIDLLRWPGVLVVPERDTEVLSKTATEAVIKALDELVMVRRREGEHLRTLLEQRLQTMRQIVDSIKPLLPQFVQEFRQRLQARLAEIRQEVDAARLEQEVVLFAQRVDVEEELDRLSTHITEIGRVLNEPSQVGRRLDFLMQELHREANTLGAKSPDMRLTKATVDLKVLIEQMREQVQNIE
ncbi:MAG TPA: YicC/YloC family endoribonuclease [Acidiferrobacterales bacterium]|nr:YicC/YloC family endoribonuclease [Acidiferrobacterales bacterium]